MSLDKTQLAQNQDFTPYLLSDIESLEFHPAAALFPMMERSEFQKLADDIKAHGLLEPITLHHGQVLDGRNRLEACKLTGTEPRFEHVDNISSPTVYVVSKNLHRRHLSVGQRSAIAVEMLPLLREEANIRQLSGLKNQLHPSLAPIEANDGYGKSSEFAAKAVDVGRSSVERAITVKKDNPEVFEQMKRGEISNWAAHEQVIEAKKADPKIVTSESRTRARINAESHKRRMEEGLSMIAGACDALNKLNLSAIASILTEEETIGWIVRAQDARKDLASFIGSLKKGATNGIR